MRGSQRGRPACGCLGGRSEAWLTTHCRWENNMVVGVLSLAPQVADGKASKPMDIIFSNLVLMLNATWHFADVTLADVDIKLILKVMMPIRWLQLWYQHMGSLCLWQCLIQILHILLNLWQGQLHLIWAYGQLSDFYQADQLKYHGRKTRWLLNRYLQFTT